MNTKTLLAVGALAVVATSACAKDDRWRQILKADDATTWYVDVTRLSVESVTTVNPVDMKMEKVTARVVWVKRVYPKPQTTLGETYDTMVMQYFIDCETHRFARGQWVARRGDSVVDSGDDSPTARFIAVIPETVGEVAMNAMCKL